MDAANYRIELLGGVRLLQGDRVITRFKTTKNGSLLAYLAINRGRPQFRDAITDRFWPDIDPDAARNSFRVALSSLRKQLEPPGVPPNSILRSDRLQVSLNPAAFTTDVDEFEAAIRAEERIPEEDSSSDRLHLLQQAIELYHGDLMAGWYEEWIVPERTRLNDMYLGALRRLMRMYAEKQDFDRAIDCGRRAVVSDPLREEWHRSLMRLYRAQGRPAMAVRQFQDLEKVLKQELGTQPSAPTIELARQCAAGLTRLPGAGGTGMVARDDRDSDRTEDDARLAHTSRETAAAGAGTGKVGGSLPAIVTRFFGRETELQEIVSILSPVSNEDAATGDAVLLPSARLLTLTGISGTGKTRLALEAASRLKPAFEKRVWYVSVEEASEPTHILEKIGLALDPKPGPEIPLLLKIQDFLQGPPALLVLDNFEQVVETGASVVSELLNSIPGLVLLVTSQLRLGLPAEREYPVAPLDLPATDGDVESLLESPLIALFVDRAQAARPDFQLTSRNAAAVAELCSRLEGVPLAIELAAAWAQVMAPVQMLERLSDRFDLLVSTRKSSVDRRRTLRKAIDWSCSLLSEELREFLGKLAIFAGSWTSEAASALTGEVYAEQLLWQLRQRSLIRTFEAEEEMRFSMLETVRVYMKEQTPPDTLEALHARHCDYYLKFAEECGARLGGLHSASVAIKLELDHTNIRAAMHMASTQSNRIPFWRAACAIWRFWYLRGHAQEGKGILSRAISDIDTAMLLGELQGISEQEVGAIRATALQGLARLCFKLGDTSEGRTYCQEAIRTADKYSMAAAATELRATLLVGYEHSPRDLASSEMIASMGKEAAEYRLKLADRAGAGVLLSRSAGLYAQAGALSTALELTEREVRIRRELRDRPGELEALEKMQVLCKQLGEPARAESEGRAAELYLDIDISERIAASYAEIGVLAALQGDFPGAREQLEDSFATLREAPESPTLWWITEAMARVAVEQNDLQAAAVWLTELCGEYSSLRDVPGQKSTFAMFAELAARIGRSEMAAIFVGLSGIELHSQYINQCKQVLGEARWADIIARAESGMVTLDAASAMACSLASDIRSPAI